MWVFNVSASSTVIFNVIQSGRPEWCAIYIWEKRTDTSRWTEVGAGREETEFACRQFFWFLLFFTTKMRKKSFIIHFKMETNKTPADNPGGARGFSRNDITSCGKNYWRPQSAKDICGVIWSSILLLPVFWVANESWHAFRLLYGTGVGINVINIDNHTAASTIIPNQDVCTTGWNVAINYFFWKE